MDPRAFTNDPESLQELSCVICLHIPRWVVTPTNCMHIHCMTCMLQLLSQKNYSCPYCRQPSRGLRVAHDELEEMYSGLQYRCTPCSNGFPGGLVEAHERMCLQRPIQCLNSGCEGRGVLENQARHLSMCHPVGATPV